MAHHIHNLDPNPSLVLGMHNTSVTILTLINAHLFHVTYADNLLACDFGAMNEIIFVTGNAT